MSLDLNAILSQLTQVTEARKAATAGQAAALQNDTANMQQLMTVNLDAARGVADEAARIAGGQAELRAREQQLKENATAVVGLNPDDLNNKLVQGMAAFNAAEAERKEVRQQFNQLSAISFLDNPVGFLAAQLKLPQVAQRNNDLVATRNAAEQNIRTRTRLLAEHNSTVVANVAAETKDLELARAVNERRAADIKLTEAQMANASRLAGLRLQAFQLTDNLYEMDNDLITRKLQIGQHMLSLEERREARAERREARAERQAARARTAAEKLEEAERTAQLNDRFAVLSQFLGLETPMNTTIWRTIPNAAVRTMWLDAAMTGRLGPDLVSSLKFFGAQANPGRVREQNSGVSMAAQGLAAGLQSHASQIANAPQNRARPLSTEELMNQAQAAYDRALVDSANLPNSGNSLTAPVWNTTFNPYRAQHRVMADTPIPNNRFAALMAETAARTAGNNQPNVSVEDEVQAIRAMAALVRNRELTLDQAAQQVAQYYQRGILKNRDLFQHELFGLPPQTRYFVVLPPAGIFQDPIAVDLTDPTQIKRALSETARRSLPQTPAGPLPLTVLGAIPPLLNLQLPAAPAPAEPAQNPRAQGGTIQRQQP